MDVVKLVEAGLKITELPKQENRGLKDNDENEEVADEKSAEVVGELMCDEDDVDTTFAADNEVPEA